MCDNKKIAHNSFIDVDMVSQAENMLIIGNMCGFFGEFSVTSDSAHPVTVDFMNTNPAVISRLSLISDILKAGKNVTVVTNQETKEYYEMLFTFIRKEIFKFNKKNVAFKCINNDKEYIDFLDKMISNNMKFDYIVQNPPYSGSLHLDFLNKGLDLLDESGKMVIIEPATWLINVRRTGKAKLYDSIKSRLGNHVYKVVIENLNGEFGTTMCAPFSITYIDLKQEYNQIEFCCCGVTNMVKSIYDCNHIGDYDIINSIFEKVKKFDSIKQHITKKQFDDPDIYYLGINDVVYSVCGVYFVRESYFYGDTAYFNHRFGEFFKSYISPTMNINRNDITNIIPKKAARGGSTTGNVKLTDNPATSVYGTKTEIENYKYYISNNALPLFLNIVLTIDQNNTVKDYIPWLVDKQYTDSEIYQLLGITEDEQKFIDKTIKKYERHSPWFKRYMCGKDSVSNEEVQKFIDNL